MTSILAGFYHPRRYMPYDDPGLRSGDLNRSILGDTGRPTAKTIAIRKTNHGFALISSARLTSAPTGYHLCTIESVHTATAALSKCSY